MVCEYCDAARENGDKFCMMCGERLDPNAPMPYRPSPKRKYSWILKAGGLCAIQVLLIMLVEIITGWVKIGFVFDDITGREYPIYILTITSPHIVDLFNINDVGMKIVYLLEMITVTACLGLMIWQTYKRIKNRNGDMNELKDSPAYELPVIFTLYLLVEFAFIIFTTAIGGIGDTDIDDTNTGRMMFALLHASVYEELVTRLLMLGVPCLIVAFLLKREGVPMYKYLLGGAPYERWMLIFVVFSAVMFGLAHLDNWDLWKFWPTFAFGLLCGYLYLKYGLHVTIAAHFINDFLNSDQWLIGSQGMLILGLVVSGLCALPCVYWYVKKGIRFCKTKFLTMSEEN